MSHGAMVRERGSPTVQDSRMQMATVCEPGSPTTRLLIPTQKFSSPRYKNLVHHGS